MSRGSLEFTRFLRTEMNAVRIRADGFLRRHERSDSTIRRIQMRSTTLVWSRICRRRGSSRGPAHGVDVTLWADGAGDLVGSDTIGA